VTIASAFGIAPHMRMTVMLAAVQRGLLGAARALLLITGLALLVGTVGATLLPPLYMATGIAMLLLAAPLHWVGRHLQPARSLLVVLGPVVLLAGTAWTAGKSAPVWSALGLALAGMILWLLPEPHRFAPETRPGEPLLQLLSAVDQAAFSLVALVLPALLQLVGLNDLVLLGAVTLMLALLLLAFPAISLTQATVARPRTRLHRGAGGYHYSLLLLGLVGISMMVFFAVDLSLLSAVSSRFSEAPAIAGFLGSLLGAAGLISLAGGSISGWLLRRLGVPGLLQSVPTIVGSVAAAAMLTLVLSSWAAALFWLLAALKLTDVILRETIGRATVPVLLQPLSTGLRASTNLLVHWLVPGAAALLSGGTLVLVTGLVGRESILLAGTLLAAALWVGLTLPLRKAYQEALEKALERRRLEGVLSSWFREETALSIVRQGLASERPAEAIYCLDLLQELGDSQVALCLPGLLHHPSAEARREVLMRLHGEVEPLVLAEVRLLLEDDPSPEVRGAAAQLICAAGELVALEDVVPLLRCDDRPVRIGTLRGLLRCREIEPLMIAGEELNRLVGSDDWQDRLLAAEVLASEAEGKDSQRQLLELLNDEEPRVRQAALQARCLTASPRLWPAVIDNLAATESAWAAAAVLVTIGSPVVGALIATFESTVSRDVRLRTLSVLGRVGGAKVESYLWQILPESDCEVRYRILTVLAGSSGLGDRKVGTVSKMIQGELATVAWNLTALLEISGQQGTEVLASALRREVARNREMINLLIGQLAAVASVIKSLRSRDAGKLLELGPDRVGAVIESFLEAEEPEEQLLQLAEYFPVEPMSYEERLTALVGRSDKLMTTWSRACALYLMTDAKLSSVDDTVIKALGDHEPLLRETAIWVLAKLDPDGVKVHLDRARKDEVSTVSDMAEYLTKRESPCC
jgi:HEAT repeat protein